MAVKAAFKKDNPMYDPIMPPVSIFPLVVESVEMVKTYRRVGINEMNTKVNEAKNFPITILLSLRGRVDKISIVPVLNSSANDRIVSAGIKNIRIHGAKRKNLSKLAYPSSKILLSGVTHKKKPAIMINIKIAR